MKIQHIEITDFGKFHNTTLNSLDKEMVLIYGKNEAGKTTIFNLIKSLIFGFSPAKSEAHPYASWKNERIEFRATLISQKGEEVHLHRKLLSSPTGKMTTSDNLLDLRNNPLPFANHISWEIFNKIYALRVEDLIEIQGKAWDEVQDKLLANYGNINIKSTREVLKKLNDEANEIYSESTRRNTIIKKLETEIRELKKKKSEALDRQTTLKEQHQQLSLLKDKISSLLEEKILIKAQLKKAKVLLPIKGMMAEAEKLKNRLNHHPLIHTLPQNAGNQLREAEEKKKELHKELEKRKITLSEKKAKEHIFTEEELLILDNKEMIEEEYSGFLRLEGILEEKDQLQVALMKVKDRLNHEARNLLSGEMREDVAQRIKVLSIPELRLLITAYDKLKGDLKEIEGLLQYQKHQKKEIKASITYIIAGVIGTIFLLVGLFIKQTALLTIGGIAIVFAITDWFNGQRIKKQMMADTSGENNKKQLEKNKIQLTKELEEKRNILLERFDGIPIPQLVLENIQEYFLTNLVKVKDLIFEVEEKEKVLKEKNREIAMRWENLNSFLRQFGLEEMEANQQLRQLKNQATTLQSLKSSNTNLGDTIEELDRDIKDQHLSYQQVVDKYNGLEEKLLQIGGDSVEEGIKILEENYQIQLKINLIEEKLAEIPDLQILMEEINRYTQEEAWIFSDLELERAEEKVEELEETLQQLKDEKKELEIKNLQIMKATTVDEIESEIMLIETKINENCIKRDRLLLLKEVIGKAEEDFREENQPDVLKNASHYLKIITGGKYTNIYLEDTGEGTNILLKEKGHPIPRRTNDHFSKGTLHQLYLSLRLSLIDHLDKNGENLPISFDELLINWDEERLDHNLQLLKEISKKRQLFMFTCHDWFAEKIETSFNIKRIDLNQ